MEISPGPGWEEVMERLRRERGTTLLLGAVDTGKSTLARYLVAGLATAGLPVALVDSDVGQSALCLPGTVGMKLFRGPDDVAAYRCDRISFLGSASPTRILPRFLEATARLTQSASGLADLVIIDTTGLVEGITGCGLKLAKVRLTRPRRIIALQRNEECEPILERLEGLEIQRLSPHPEARSRSREARARSRSDRLAAYFAACGPREMLLHGERIELYRMGQPVSLRHVIPESGTVIGLNHGEETLGLGFVTEADREGITFRSPLGSVAGVRRVVFGDIVL